MKKTTKVVLGSAMTMAMCASLIAGSTLALFSSEDSVNIAVTSGKVDVKASVTALWTNSNAVEEVAIEEISDWTAATDTEGSFTGTFENKGTATYEVTDGKGTLTLNNIAPGDAVKFTLSVENKSTISVKYQVRIAVGKEGSTEPDTDKYSDSKLSSVLELYFNGKTMNGFTNAATDWSAVTAPDPVASPVTQDVVLRLPKDAGDEYQTKSCDITLSVLAVQGNGSETDFCETHGGHSYDLVTNTCIYCGAENPIKGHYDEDSGTFVLDSLADPDATEVTVPGTMGGAPVSIADGAFKNNENLKSVTLGEGITEIGANAFNDCRNLTQVTLPETLTSIDNNAFENCIQLQSIEIPDSVESIGTDAFLNCFELQSVTLGAGITEIAADTFYNCNALTSITFEGDVTTIGESAFSGCDRLTTIELPDSLTTIGDSAFHNCPLETIQLPAMLETIGDSAFGRSALTEIVIPDSVTSLGKSVFTHCANLKTVTLGTGIDKISRGLFYGCTNLDTLIIKGRLKPSTPVGDPFYDCSSPLITITYAGSSEEWKAVAEKGIWSGCTSEIHVTCQEDGVTLDKNGEVV